LSSQSYNNYKSMQFGRWSIRLRRFFNFFAIFSYIILCSLWAGLFITQGSSFEQNRISSSKGWSMLNINESGSVVHEKNSPPLFLHFLFLPLQLNKSESPSPNDVSCQTDLNLPSSSSEYFNVIDR